MRPMAVEFSDDPACAHLDRQYLLGPDLLVAPVFSADGDTSYYVPAGRWTHLLTGAVVEGPRWVRETCGFDTVPLLVRPGAVIPWGARDDRPDYDFADGVTLRPYELADGGRVVVTVPGLTGAPAGTFEVSRAGGTLRVTRDGAAPAPWHVQLPGGTPVAVPAGTATREIPWDPR
jgi:alpha-D-xyloside xylohydrolase